MCPSPGKYGCQAETWQYNVLCSKCVQVQGKYGQPKWPQKAKMAAKKATIAAKGQKAISCQNGCKRPKWLQKAKMAVKKAKMAAKKATITAKCQKGH